MLAELIANYINAKRKELGLSIKDIADATNDQAPESTIKNLCHKKTDNPGIGTLKHIMDVIGGSFDEMLYPERSKGEVTDAAVFAQKELYEYQLATLKETNEAHVANIRAHYEQHIAEKNESFAKIEAHYEKRLADKREVIAELEKHLVTVNEHLITAEKEKKWFRWGFVIAIIVFAALCIAELAHPTKGWITW